MDTFIHLAVVLVEDEGLIRMAISEALRDEGFTVYEAVNSGEALLIFEQKKQIVGLFTDVEMQGSMNGLSFAHVVAERWPAIKIFITSGRTFPKATQLPRGATFMPKPYGLSEIAAFAQKLRQANS